ncbi:MAG: hypothetical protein ACE361_11745 [Aureliella sp.]
MKRSTFFYVVFRIVFTTAITSNLTLKLAAHDLPSDARSFNHARMAATQKADQNRLRSTRAKANEKLPTVAVQVCHLADWAGLPTPSTREIRRGNLALHRDMIAPPVLSSNAENIGVVELANGSAEDSTQTVAEVQNKREFDERYLPYDLSMRDWRHREFSSRANGHITKRPIVVNSVGQVRQRGLGERLLESVQNQVLEFGDRLHKSAVKLQTILHPESAGRYLAQASNRIASAQRVAVSQSSVFMAQTWRPNLNPFFRGPHLVNITLPDGQPLLVSLETATSLGVIGNSSLPAPSKLRLPNHDLLDTQVAKMFTGYIREIGSNYRACLTYSLRSLAIAMDINRVQRIARTEAQLR